MTAARVRPSPRRILAARIIAVTADALQLGLFPVFVQGAVSPASDAVDLVVAALLLWLLGWHVAFLPSFIIELIPMADLFPTWTAAVFFVTRKGGSS